MCGINLRLRKHAQENPVDDRWVPFKVSKCMISPCEDTSRIFKYIVEYFVTKVKAAIDLVKIVPFEEKNLRRESEKFSEVPRITKAKYLSVDEKVEMLSVPTKDSIAETVRTTLVQLNMISEVALYAMILLDRFLEVTNWTLRSSNWKILFVLSLRLALKHEGNASPRAERLEEIYPLYKSKEYIDLEALYLRLLDYRLFVSLEDFAERVSHVLPQEPIEM